MIFNSTPNGKNPSSILTEIRVYAEAVSHSENPLSSVIRFDFEFDELDNPMYDFEPALEDTRRYDDVDPNGYGNPEARNHARKVLGRLQNLKEAS